MKVIRTGTLYLAAERSPPWTKKIDEATRYEEATAIEIVRHIKQGPLKPDGITPQFPNWKWVQSPVVYGKIVGYRAVHTVRPITLDDGTTGEATDTKMVRFEDIRTPDFELIEVTTGRVESLLERFLRTI